MDGIDDIVELLAAIAQRNRVRILMMLRRRELSVGQITRILRTRRRKIDLSTVSRHLGVLQRAGLLESRRDCARILYTRAQLGRNRALQQVVEGVESGVRRDAEVAKDLKAVKRLLKQDGR